MELRNELKRFLESLDGDELRNLADGNLREDMVVDEYLASLSSDAKDEGEDSYWMDDDEEDEILGYECFGCGNVQYHQSGFGCDKCMGHCLEPWYG